MKRFAILSAAALCLMIGTQSKASGNGGFKLSLSGGFFLTLEGNGSFHNYHPQPAITHYSPYPNYYYPPAATHYNPYPANELPQGGAEKEGPAPTKEKESAVPNLQPASYQFVVPDYWYNQ